MGYGGSRAKSEGRGAYYATLPPLFPEERATLCSRLLFTNRPDRTSILALHPNSECDAAGFSPWLQFCSVVGEIRRTLLSGADWHDIEFFGMKRFGESRVASRDSNHSTIIPSRSEGLLYSPKQA